MCARVGDVDLAPISASEMKVNQVNPHPPLPPPPLCLDGGLMKVQRAISSSRNLVITLKAVFKIPLITA